MQTIHFSDIYGQYLTMKAEIDEAIQDVIKSTRFIKSGKVLEFEKSLSEYVNTNVISCGNGTDALQLAFMALDLKPGDEVITTPFTFVSTVEVLMLLGLKPVFVDVNPLTFNLDVDWTETAISEKTKAVLPVHLFGQCADMEAIMEIAQKNNLFVVEDACQALGTESLFSDGSKRTVEPLEILDAIHFSLRKTSAHLVMVVLFIQAIKKWLRSFVPLQIME